MRERISLITLSFLSGTALFFDFLQAILNVAFIGIVLNFLINIIAWLTFYLWFKLLGVGLIDSGIRKAVIMWGGMLLELIPIFNTLPVWTATIALTAFIVRWEDVAHNRAVRAEEEQRAKEILAEAV